MKKLNLKKGLFILVTLVFMGCQKKELTLSDNENLGVNKVQPPNIKFNALAPNGVYTLEIK